MMEDMIPEMTERSMMIQQEINRKRSITMIVTVVRFYYILFIKKKIGLLFAFVIIIFFGIVSRILEPLVCIFFLLNNVLCSVQTSKTRAGDVALGKLNAMKKNAWD